MTHTTSLGSLGEVSTKEQKFNRWRGAILAGAILLILAGFAIGAHGTSRYRTARAEVSVGSITLATGVVEYPFLKLSVERAGGGWIIVDPDGDIGVCPMLPATYADLDRCEHKTR